MTDSETPEIVLLLWDIQFSVLLAQHTLKIPSSLDRDASKLSIRLVQGSRSQALLILSPILPPSKSKTDVTKLRASILAIPFSVPPSSTIVSALGKASTGSRWLESSTSSVQSLHASHEDLLRKLQDAVEEEKPEEADSIFFGWVEEETAKLKEKKDASAEDKGEKESKLTVGIDTASSLVSILTSLD